MRHVVGRILPYLVPSLVLAAGAAACAPASSLSSASSPSSAAAPAPPAAPSAVDTARSTFVVLIADTLAVERFTRTPTRISGELAMRQQGVMQTWTIELAPSGLATGARTVVRRLDDPPSAAPLQSASITLAGDSATIVAGDAERRIAVPRGTLPFVNLSAGVIEQILRQARAAGGDTTSVPLLPFGAPGAMPASVRWTAADSAAISLGGVELRTAVDDDGALLGASVPSQGVRFVRAAGDVALAGATPDYSPPPGAPYTAEDVTVRNEAGGVTLAGTLTLPRGASADARAPAVVLVSGTGPQDRDGASPALRGWEPFRELADTLSRRGIAVLRLDDRGVGGSQAGQATATTEDLAGDVRAALDFLRARPEIDPARLGVVGHSEGGIIAPMVARTAGPLGAVVLMAAPSRPGRVVSDSQVVQVMREQGVPAARHDSLLRANARLRDSTAAGSPWMAFWLDYDPLPAARELRAPTLVVQGDTDRQVTPDQARELAAAIRGGGNDDVTVRTFPDVNHLLVRDPNGTFSGYASLPSLELAPEVKGAVVEWLVGKLGGE